MDLLPPIQQQQQQQPKNNWFNQDQQQQKNTVFFSLMHPVQSETSPNEVKSWVEFVASRDRPLSWLSNPQRILAVGWSIDQWFLPSKDDVFFF